MEEKFKRGYTRIADLYDTGLSEVDKEHTLKGHIRYIRKGNGPLFVRLYDGTCRIVSDTFQLVFADDKKDDLAISLVIGDTISVTGKIVKSVAKEQPIEMLVDKLEIIGKIEKPETYFAGAKTMPLVSMRTEENIHLRPRFAWSQAIYRIRDTVTFAFHEYMHKHGTLHLDPNIITKSDCEGGGEAFLVSSLSGLKDGLISKIPRKKIIKTIAKEDGSIVEESHDIDEIDWSHDFFSSQCWLTVSSQLQLEALCHALGAVYTTNASFRAEESTTNRHLASFLHGEFEYPFIDMNQLMDILEDIVKYLLTAVIVSNEIDLKIIEKCSGEIEMLEYLKQVVSQDFKRISYDDAITICSKDIKEIRKKFKKEKVELVKWGQDLGSYYERYLSEDVYKKPVFIHSYPAELKSFYMKKQKPYEYVNPDGGITIRNTVMAIDLLSSVGEISGSSIRTDDYNELLKVMQDRKMDIDKYKWYLDLRKTGSTPTGGAGLGIERIIQWICRCSIHDVSIFPVSYKKCWM
jgi:asparaginyl-tRNA synthetase